MEIVSLTQRAAQARTVVALGFFDGLHIGHRTLLGQTVALAGRLGATPAVFSFSDGSGVKPGIPRLLPESQRLEEMGKVGIERVFLGDFARMHTLSPDAFIRDVLLAQCGAVAAVCGFNFRFGTGGLGDVALLSSLLATHGVSLTVIPACLYDGAPVSASAVRQAIAKGDMARAAALLGRPYSLTGEVVHGKALGRRIGVPTANLPFPPSAALPARGVYAVSCTVEREGEALFGVANVGTRPTVEEGAAPNCEVHLFGEVGDLYGRRLTVRFFAHIRDEMKFEDTVALQEQIRQDEAIAKEYEKIWNGQS